MRVQEIAKKLISNGLTKMKWDSKLKCNTGDFRINKFIFGNMYASVDVNTGVFNKQYKGKSIEQVMEAINNIGLKCENRNGIIAIIK